MSTWHTSSRRDRLPPDWQSKIQPRILKRDRHECQVIVDRDSRGRPIRCRRPANEVDHEIPNDDHRDTNLRAICSWHHGKKSSSEGNAARAKKRREIDQRFRRTEDHPSTLL